jgi:hypothetical protein
MYNFYYARTVKSQTSMYFIIIWIDEVRYNLPFIPIMVIPIVMIIIFLKYSTRRLLFIVIVKLYCRAIIVWKAICFESREVSGFITLKSLLLNFREEH